MKLIECGYSVFKKYLGEKSTSKDYVFVLRMPKDFSLQTAFDKMLSFLAKKNITVVNNINETTVLDKDGNTYTIAHSIKPHEKKKDLLITKPDTFFRHCYSRIFQYETLYVNEDEEITTYFNTAKTNIENRLLATTPVHQLIFEKNKLPILLKFIEFYSKYGFRIYGAQNENFVYGLNRERNILENEQFVNFANADFKRTYSFFRDYGIDSILNEKPFKLNISIEK